MNFSVIDAKFHVLFMLFSPAHILFATKANRLNPDCEPHLDDALHQESAHSRRIYDNIIFPYVSCN